MINLQNAPISKISSRDRVTIHRLAFLAAAVVLLGLALYHLPDYPLTWFDEGSHLHVPKTLIQTGVYADRSSEGFRYYGPTLGLGPTVMLPIAGAFRLFGTGLVQARLVIVLYLLASVAVFALLARRLGGQGFAWAASALLVSAPAVALVETGRQVLGEVPGLFFLIAGLLAWFSAWERPAWPRLALAGLLLGLSAVTKSQNLIFLAPVLLLAWLANAVYYHQAPARAFLVPGVITAAVYLAWQAVLLFGLGPSTARENLAYLVEATRGAALAFSPALMKNALGELLSYKAYFGLLIPALLYGATLALPRTRDGLRWGVLLGLVGVNLAWYVLASIGWARYAFVGLALSSLFVARLLSDLTGGFRFLARDPGLPPLGLRLALGAWLAAMVLFPLAQTGLSILRPPENTPAEMAAYLDENVPKDALIETWEPELGFLTGHTYHFAPQALLNQAVAYIWLGKTPTSLSYLPEQWASAPYLLVGPFARWVGLYPPEIVRSRYRLVTQIGGYELYALNP